MFMRWVGIEYFILFMLVGFKMYWIVLYIKLKGRLNIVLW